MTWTPASIVDVKSRARVEAVIGHATKLVRSGDGLVGCCCLPGHKDDTPSLSVDVKKQLWRCHGCGAGGDVVAFVKAMRGLTFAEAMKALAAEHGGTLVEQAAKGERRIVATYPYTDAASTLLYTIERWEPGKHGRGKDFVQRRADGVAKKNDVQVLYRLPDVIAAVAAGQVVCVVEGEKAADALRARGVTATTHAGGSAAARRTWTAEFCAPLKGAKVWLLPDNDDVGRHCMDEIAKVLVDVAAEVRVVILPVEGKGDDAVEWIAAGGTQAQIEALAAKAPALRLDGSQGEHLTDSGNAERWAKRFGVDFRRHSGRGQWLRWTGQRWADDGDAPAFLSTKETARSWLADVNNEESAARRIELVKHANRSESSKMRKAMLDLAAAESGMTVSATDLDADPWLLNCKNGVVDLKTGRLRPHRREDLCTKMVPTAFDESAKAPAFESFLASSLPDVEVRGFVQRFFGYALTGVVHEHVLPVFWGSGGNGKGTLVESVKAVVGDYAQAVPAELLIQRQGESHPTERAMLLGLRLAFASETGAGQSLNEKTVKTLTGGDTISARFMRQDFFNFAPTHKLVMQTNIKPIVKGTDNGIWRRVRLVPFDIQINKPDVKLKEKLDAERPGILRWLIEGCLAWQAHGLGSAGRIDEATAEYKSESDRAGLFLEDCCVCTPDIRTRASELYSAYRKWADERGEHPWSQTTFGTALREKGLQSLKTNGVKVYVGVGVAYQGTEGHLGSHSRQTLTEKPKSLEQPRDSLLPSLYPLSNKEQQQSSSNNDDDDWVRR